MISFVVSPEELWDEKNEVFICKEPVTIRLEHSLRAVSKWEARHCKPFIGKKEWTADEMLDYVRCMCLDDRIDPAVFLSLSAKQMEAVRTYIDLPMTATWFSDKEQRGSGRGGSAITSELIYFWMSSYGIDWQAQDWHLNRLITLIRICSEKNKPPKKMSKGAAAARQRALNAKRLKQFHTGG